MKKMLCLLLAACMLFASLVSCNGGGGVTDGGDKNGDWKNLDFGGATLTVSVTERNSKGTFQGSDVYMKGPDKADTSEPVQKKVLARNKKVCEDLDMTIAYQESNHSATSDILSHLERLVAGDAADAPDVYNEYAYALFCGMMNGYFWNVTDPGTDAEGNEVKSYFEFDHECWYKTYMQGATFSKDKQYILVGDYNIDIVRWACVLFVNVDRWNQTFGGFTENSDYYNFRNYESVCDFIAGTQEWFYDDLITLSNIAHIDGTSPNGAKDKADLTDEQVGVFLNPRASRLFPYYGSGHSIFEWTKNGKIVGECEGVPSMVTDISALAAASLKFTELYNAKGVYNFPDWSASSEVDCVNEFINNKAIMATAALGEMESSSMRDTSFKRGVLPYPRYSRAASKLITSVDCLAVVSAILCNTSNFALASAYLQYVNEESTDILDFYYEDVLKFKYNDSRGARKMIDLIIDNVASPCEDLLSLYLCSAAGATGRPADSVKFIYEFFAADAKNNTTALRSSYDKQRDVLQAKLNELYAKFNELE